MYICSRRLTDGQLREGSYCEQLLAPEEHAGQIYIGAQGGGGSLIFVLTVHLNVSEYFTQKVMMMWISS